MSLEGQIITNGMNALNRGVSKYDVGDILIPNGTTEARLLKDARMSSFERGTRAAIAEVFRIDVHQTSKHVISQLDNVATATGSSGDKDIESTLGRIFAIRKEYPNMTEDQVFDLLVQGHHKVNPSGLSVVKYTIDSNKNCSTEGLTIHEGADICGASAVNVMNELQEM